MSQAQNIPTLALPNGENVDRFGIGTWNMGERASEFQTEVDTVRHALESGIRMIDTAEMYGEGGAEKVVGKAVLGLRDKAFIVSKVYPHNASTKGVASACERSLKRLDTDYIDLYLLHWRGNIPLQETLDAFLTLKDSGKIRHFGVSNFDVEDMQEWVDLAGGDAVATNQVLYSLAKRWPEARLLPWCQTRNISVMAYTPLEPLMTRNARALDPVAKRHFATPAQIALAYVLRTPGVIAIPKSSKRERITENLGAVTIKLTDSDIAELSEAFPPPSTDARMELR